MQGNLLPKQSGLTSPVTVSVITVGYNTLQLPEQVRLLNSS